METKYEPKSDALKAFAASDESTSDQPPTAENLRLLIAMTRDEDRSNRDWATFLLAICALDTPEIREVLLSAANDADEYVRGEAISGLTERDPQLALPLVQKALSSDKATVQIFEAAELLAHPSLVEGLRHFTGPSDDKYVDDLATAALEACETGIRPYPPKTFVRST